MQQARSLRAAGQHLLQTAEPPSLTAVVGSVVGINAQRSSAMYLSLRARSPGLRQGAVEEAVAGDRSLVRTWAMRGTIHLLAADDVQWLVSTLAPTLIARGRRRMTGLGLDEGLVRAGTAEIRAALGRRAEPLTRWELMDELADRGIKPGQEVPGADPSHPARRPDRPAVHGSRTRKRRSDLRTPRRMDREGIERYGRIRSYQAGHALSRRLRPRHHHGLRYAGRD